MHAGLTTAGILQRHLRARLRCRRGLQRSPRRSVPGPPPRDTTSLFAPAVSAVLRSYPAELREHTVAQIARNGQRAGLQNVEQLLPLAVLHAPVFLSRAAH